MKIWKVIVPVSILAGGIIIGFQWLQPNPYQALPVAVSPSSANTTPSAPAGNPQTASAPRHLVITSPAEKAVVNNHLSAIGTSRAVRTVTVTPWSSGTMNILHVSAGASVKAGDLIARLDCDNEEIALDRAKVELDEAQQAYDRIIRLRATKTVSEVQEITTRLALSTAKLKVKDAELALERRTIRAPLDGIVGILPVDAGNYVTTDTAIARIDDRSQILIDVWVPERFAPLVKIGQEIEASSVARPGEVFTGHISAIDNMVDEASRTLRVRAMLPNTEDRLRAGMSFGVTFSFKGDPYPSVNPLAIQWNGEGSFVWRVNDGRAKRVPVSIVQRNTTNILVSGDLAENDTIIIQGVQNIRDGALVNAQDANTIDQAPVAAIAGQNTQ